MAFLPPFERTECACIECVRLCKSMPGHLVPGDIFAIADHLIAHGRITERRELFPFLRASKGAVVGNIATGKRHRIGTITPQLEHGKCVFLTDDDRCSIHAVAPFGCRMFDTHMEQLEGDYKSLWGLKQITITPAYEQLRQSLIARDGEAEPFTHTKDGTDESRTP